MTWLWSTLVHFFLDRIWSVWKEWQAERRGKREAEREALEDEKRRLEKGRKALRDADGVSPDEQLRRNDGRW